jgi:photosystem I subunit XI
VVLVAATLAGLPEAFVTGLGHRSSSAGSQTSPAGSAPLGAAPVAAVDAELSLCWLVGFGAGFGLLLSAVHRTLRPAAGRVVRKAERMERMMMNFQDKRPGKLAVVDKDNANLAYLTNIPRTIIEKKTLDNLLAITPRSQWENPEEGTPLHTLKLYAETYGEGKATKMSWWDFLYLRVAVANIEADMDSIDYLEARDKWFREILNGRMPVSIPGPYGYWDTGALINYRGKEMFAGDQIQSPITDSLFSKQFIDNLAFYREGLKPWQRGLEIGMAHGYFIIGPFVSLGPLRNTPEAATVGLLAGVALIGIVSMGGLLFGAVVKPTRFDRPGDAEGAGYQQMINWHAVGGFGGAGFAHALITVFGS